LCAPLLHVQGASAVVLDVVIAVNASAVDLVLSALQTDVTALGLRVQARLGPVGVFVSEVTVQVCGCVCPAKGTVWPWDRPRARVLRPSHAGV
jgi:hypothetical protein